MKNILYSLQKKRHMLITWLTLMVKIYQILGLFLSFLYKSNLQKLSFYNQIFLLISQLELKIKNFHKYHMVKHICLVILLWNLYLLWDIMLNKIHLVCIPLEKQLNIFEKLSIFLRFSFIINCLLFQDFSFF